MFGNVSVCGVMLAYVPDGFPETAGLGLWPRRVGERVQARLVELLDAKRIRPIVGRSAAYTELPAELERLERRETTGRTILRW